LAIDSRDRHDLFLDHGFRENQDIFAVVAVERLGDIPGDLDVLLLV
jgi:hypothetical protein